MPGKYKPVGDGTFMQMGKNGPIGVPLTPTDIEQLEQYEAINNPNQGDRPHKTGRLKSQLNKVYHDLKLEEKRTDPEYEELYSKLKTGTDIAGEGTWLPQSVVRKGLIMGDLFNDMGNTIADFAESMDDKFPMLPIPFAEGYDKIPAKLERDKERSELIESKAYDALQETSTWGDQMVGGMMPFMLTGQAEVPAARALYGASKIIPKGTNKILSTQDLIPELKSKALNKLNLYDTPHPQTGDVFADFSGSIMGGALEGSLVDERTALGGAVENVLGSVGGRAIASPARRTENFNKILNPEVDKVITDASDLGKQYMPGFKYGRPSKQTRESSMRGNPETADDIKVFDHQNAQVDNREISTALGINNPEGISLNQILPTKLAQVKETLNRLNSEIKGRWSNASTKRINETSKRLHARGTPSNDLAAQYLDSYMRQMRDMTKRGGTDLEGNTFDGHHFQEIDSDLASDIRLLSDNGDNVAADALRAFRLEMKSSVRNATIPYKGNAQIDEWENAMEDFALTNLVSKNVGKDGIVDMVELHKHFDATDMRYGTDDPANKLNNVYKLAEAESLHSATVGAGLGQSSMKEFDSGRDYSLRERAMQSDPGWWNRMILGWYRTGIPDRGLPPEASSIVSRVSGANLQNLGPHEKVAEGVNTSVDSLMEIKDYLLEFMSDEEEDPTQDLNGATQ